METQAVFNSMWDILQKPMFAVGGEGVSIVSFVYFAIVIIVSVGVSRLVIRLLQRNVYSKTEIEQGAQYTLSRLIKYVIFVLGFLIGLQMIGFDLSVLTVFGGLFGIGIGFGLQNIFSNFASGLILLMERPVQVGDIVELDGLLGRVTEIRFRVAIVTTFDNESIIVPNSDLVSERVTNWSYGGDTTLRLRIPIGVAYGTDVDLVENILLEIAESEQNVMPKPSPEVFFKEHGDSSLNFELRVWVPSPAYRIEASNNIRKKIDSRFTEEGIEIPFPQRDNHVFFEEEYQMVND
ncbi:mechanosensitive ion channel [Candidatus Bipolaricaulota bacterium]|nr:mechanosensitive ion channel [Candidatus Bipolaricaulota bacterium]